MFDPISRHISNPSDVLRIFESSVTLRKNGITIQNDRWRSKGEIENFKNMGGLRNVSRYRIKNQMKVPFDKNGILSAVLSFTLSFYRSFELLGSNWAEHSCFNTAMLWVQGARSLPQVNRQTIQYKDVVKAIKFWVIMYSRYLYPSPPQPGFRIP